MPLNGSGGGHRAGNEPGAGRDEVRGIGDLARLIVTKTYLGHPRLHRALVITLGVLVATCLIAVVTRLSALPLIPLPLFGAAGYALWRIRGTQDHRALLGWSAVFLGTTVVGFWLVSVAARILD